MGKEEDSAIHRGPRIPVQDRSKARVEKILKATESIVLEGGWGAATAHAIAKRAKVPPAGVYHFFPDRFTIYAKLLEGYFADFRKQLDLAVSQADPADWRELVDTVMDTFADFFRENDCARILALGGAGTHEMRWSSTRNSDGMAMVLQRVVETYFVLPDDPAITERFRMGIYLSNAGFSHAVRVSDPMDDWVVEETKVAIKSYMATWIGDPPRRG